MACDKLNADDKLLEGNEFYGNIDGNVSATEEINYYCIPKFSSFVVLHLS